MTEQQPSGECRLIFPKQTKKAQRAFWRAVLLADPCAYCGYVGPGMEVEHIQPKAGGGSDHPDNLASACHDCNMRKSTMNLLGFIGRRQFNAYVEEQHANWMAMSRGRGAV